MIKLDYEAAKNEFIRWARDPKWELDFDVEEYLDGSLDADDPDLKNVDKDAIESIINNLKKGVLVLEDDNEGHIKVRHNLKRPIQIESGVIDHLYYRELDVGSMVRAHKNKEPVALVCSLIAQMSGKPVNLIYKMHNRDFSVCDKVYLVFFIS